MYQIQISKSILLKIFENAAIYLVGFAMLLYGIGKPLQFNNTDLLSKTVSSLSGMEIMWAFYGYSKSFALVLGFLEITGALLLFFNRTKIIGCFILTTILINVILQDIFYAVNVGALIAAIIYQLLICFILVCNRNKLLAALKIIMAKNIEIDSYKQKLWIIICSITIFIMLKFIEYLVTH